jgi:hypothetical protein
MSATLAPARSPAAAPTRATAPARPSKGNTSVEAPGTAAVRVGSEASRSIRLRQLIEQIAKKAANATQAANAKKEANTRKAAGTASAPGAPAGGAPLPPDIQRALERGLGADLGSVRVHTDGRAKSAAESLSARAFTVGNHIFLGPGERPTNLRLLAHEVAHVLQQHGAPALQRWAPGQGGSHEQEAHRAAEAVGRGETFNVKERTSGFRVQRLGISDALGYFADRANNIPGFRMFTIVLGVNPINMSRVDRSPANIMRAAVEFIPGGGLITQALDNHGVFDRVATWVEQQIRSLGMTGASIRDALMRFLDSLGLSDLLDLGGVWERAKRTFSEPIQRITSFLGGLVDGIGQLIKDAIRRPLGRLAEGTHGYDLLKAVLGRDPITGEAAPRNADVLIGGFMKLIGQEEIWNNLKRANAVSRAMAWFQGALGELLGFVQQIPGLFLQALRSLSITDIVLLPRAFARVASVFGSFIGSFSAWAGRTIWNLLEIIFSVVAPGVMVYLRRAAGAFRTILRNPIGFVGNLVRAGLLGLRQFSSRFLTHLRASLIGWLTGAMSGLGIYIPQGFTLLEIIKFVLSVLGLTWQNIRQKLVRGIGETAVRALEVGFDIVRTLVTQGPAAAWERIQESLSNLREMVMEQIMTFVRDRVVQAAITRLVTSLNPAGAFIQAVIAIYNTVMFFVERLRQIGQVAAAMIDSIAAIASGSLGAAANRVEQTMAGLLTLVISFLARIAGLGRVTDAVTNVVNRVRAPIDRALDRVVDWIVAQARRLGRLLMGGARRVAARILQWWRVRKPFADARGQQHTVYFQGEAQNATLKVASTPMPILAFLATVRPALARPENQRYQPFYDSALYLTGQINGLIDQLRRASRDDPNNQRLYDQMQAKIDLLVSRSLRVLMPLAGPAGLTEGRTEYDAQSAHEFVMARMSGSNKSLLKGHGRFTGGHAGRAFSVPTRDAVDDIGYADGDHSNQAIKTPGTNPARSMPGSRSRLLNRGHWIPDHQPPDELARGGATGLVFRFYPHSQQSARAQGGAVRVYKMWMKERRGKGESDWAVGIVSSWFW